MIRSAMSVTKRTPRAAKGMVVAEHPLGAEVGGGILARGGNAVDAAVATAFAMPVVEPFMSTIAGGGSFLIHLARRGETVAIDANVEAPAACHEACYPLTEGQGVGPVHLAPRRGRRQHVRPALGGRAGLGGGPVPGARALRHDGAGRRAGPGHRARRERLHPRTGTSR